MKCFILLLIFTTSLSVCGKIVSHPPMRPLPQPVDRPLTEGPHKFVDVNQGLDTNSGTKEKPWKTLAHAIEQLRPGDTLYLRGGTYYERVSTSIKGTREKPVIIASYPGELAVIDGGIREFYEKPETAWEPYPEGADGEYLSTKAYPELEARINKTNLLGNFGESMVPLFGYRDITDLRSNNHKFKNLGASKTDAGKGIYCGPGVYLNPETHRIHIRLAHTQQPSIGEENNYRGETDPRKLSLIIAGAGGPTLDLSRAEYITLGDLVVRGARDATINMENSLQIILDGITSFGGASALRAKGTQSLICLDSSFRGIAAPWIWRWSLKYRAIESRIVSASQWNPPARGNKNFIFSRCEFTDSVDGVFVGNVDECLITGSYMDNVSDDGFFLTSRTAYDGTTPSGNIRINQSRISRTLTALAFGVGHGRQRTINEQGHKQLGAECVFVLNVFDCRDPVLYQQPTSGPITTYGRIAGDHGSPVWEPILFSTNTVYSQASPWRNYYAAGLARGMKGGTTRNISINQFIHESGMPGEVLPQQEADLKTEKNIHWSNEFRDKGREKFLNKFRSTAIFIKTKWTEDDFYLSPEEAPSWLGANLMKAVGARGRLTIEGKPRPNYPIQPLIEISPGITETLYKTDQTRRYPLKGKAAMVKGYPAFDAPILQFAMEKAGMDVEVFEKEWLQVEEFSKYDCVVFLGSTTRAGIKHLT